jgi:hypothetical protein
MPRAHQTALASFGLLLISSTPSFAQVGAMCIPSGVNPALYSDCRLAVAPTGQAVCQCATGPDRRADPSGVPGPAGPALSGGVAPGRASPSAAAPTAAAPTSTTTPTAAPSPTVTGAIGPTGGNPGNDKVNPATGVEPGQAGEKSAGLGGFQATSPNDGLAQGGTDGGATAEGQGRSDMK